MSGSTDLPPELDERVRSELAAGERLVWAGQPRPRYFMLSSIPFVFFGIFFTGFALFWMAAASGMLFGGFGNAGPQGGFGAFISCFPLFGIPFVLVGLVMLTSPFWLARKARRTCYALTDRRAIVWEARWFGGVEVRSYGPSDLNRIVRTERSGGGGDLVFEELLTLGHHSDGHRTTNIRRRGFLGIDNVREVEELLRKTLLSDGGRH